MMGCMVPDLQKQFMDISEDPKALMAEIEQMFKERARVERFDTFTQLMSCRLKAGAPVSPHILKMKRLLEHLTRLGHGVDKELAADFVLHSLPDAYRDFVGGYNMHDMDKTVSELHGMLVTHEKTIKGKPKEALMVNKQVSFKKAGKGKDKAPTHLAGKIRHPKGPKVPAATKAGGNPKTSQAVCFYCQKPGHWKKDCKKHKEYLKSGASTSSVPGIYVIELNLSLSSTDSWVLDTGAESHICVNLQILRSRRSLGRGEVDLRVGDGGSVSTTSIGTISLSMPTGLVLVLNNVYCAPTFCRNIISISQLDREGYWFSIDNGTFSIFMNDVCYGNATLVGGLYV